MAKLALTVVGGIIGAYFGQPELGLMLGGLVGSLVIRPPGIHNEGPRLNDRQVMSGADGAPIPFGYGTIQLAGQVIWGKKDTTGQIIHETKTTTEQSSKGGPSVSNTTYSYSATFAVAFGEGPGDIIRIWADSKLIYSRGLIASRGDWAVSVVYNQDDVVKDGSKYYKCHVPNTSSLFNEPTAFFGSLFWTPFTPPKSQAISKYPQPTFYRGDETQLPDPSIQADVGASLAPGYRGLIYCVFEDLPLKDFGNRLPNLRAEVAYATTTANSSNVFDYPYSSPGARHLAFAPAQVIMDRKRSLAYIIDELGLRVERYNTGTAQVEVAAKEAQYFEDNRWPFQTQAEAGNAVVDSKGFLWGVKLYVSVGDLSYVYAVVQYDPYTFKEVKRVILNPLAPPVPPPTYPYVQSLSGFDGVFALSFFTDASGRDFIAVSSTTSLIYTDHTTRATVSIIDCASGQIIGTAALESASGSGPGFLPFSVYSDNMVVFDNDGNVWFAGSEDTGGGGHTHDTWYIWRVNCGNGGTVEGANINGIYGVDRWSFADEGSPTNPTPSTGQGSTAKGCMYDATANTLIIFMNACAANGAPVANQGGAIKIFDIATTSIVLSVGNSDTMPWSPGGSNQTFLLNAQQGVDYGRITDGILRIHKYVYPTPGVLELAKYRASDLTLLGTLRLKDYTSQFYSNELTWAGWAIDYNTNSMVTAVYNGTLGFEGGVSMGPYKCFQIYLDRLNRLPDSLDAVVQDLCERAQIADSELDVSPLAGQTIHGYGVTTMTDARRLIQNLATAKFFDGAESDFKLKFVPRGAVPTITVPETELGLVSDNKKLSEVIGQEQDLPWKVLITYSNVDANYEPGKQEKQRNARIVHSKNQIAIEMPIVMSDADAKAIAEKWLNIKRAERQAFQLNLWKATRLVFDPTDVINFVYEGLTFGIRITDVKIGQNFTMQVSGVSEDFNKYLSQSIPGNADGFTDPGLNLVSATLLFLFDIPLLSDTDAPSDGTTGTYYGEAPLTTDNWPSGVVYKSTDGATYNNWGFSSTGMPYGTLNAAVAVPLSDMRWDYITTVNVSIPANVNFTPASVTDLDVLDGANACLVQSGLTPGWEVLQYRDAVQQADGSWTLSTLLRGRRGTDLAIGGSTQGDYVIFIPTGLGRNVEPTSIIGALRYFKGVTPGQLISDVGAQTLTSKGNDLMPYAPCNIKGSLSGSDWTIGWLRRTRVGGEWRDLVGDVPLAEDGQAYKIEITDVNGIVKSTHFVGTNRLLYAGTDQTTDFGTTQSTLYVNIYQWSAVVGWGFKGHAHITHSETLPPVDGSAATNPLPGQSSGGTASVTDVTVVADNT
jgi:hypothetical protein